MASLVFRFFSGGNFARTGSLITASFWFAGLLLLAGCESEPEAEVWTFSGETMGTTYNITLVDPAGTLQRAQLQRRIDAVLEEVNQQMSTYRPDSELSQLNRAAAEQWLEVSRPLFDVLKISQEISALTGGAFDITVAPLVDLWGFGPAKSSLEIPPSEAIEKARQQIGYRYLQMRPEPMSVRKQRPLQLDLSSVAKGYGADSVGAELERMGVGNYLVEIGGELLLRGRSPRGGKWRIGIEAPSLMHSGARKAIFVSGVGVATSGDYRNYFEKDGKRYSHTIDPNTGYPITHTLASVTIVAESAARADALATALNVLGPERAETLAEEEGIAAFFIVKQDGGFREIHSSAFKVYLRD